MTTLETRFPPVALALTIGFLMWIADRSLPQFAFLLPIRGLLAVTSGAFGAVIGIAGVIEFRRAQTTVNPLRPYAAGSLVVTGVFAWTRNPMYLGLALGLLGWSLWLGNFAAVALLPVFVAYLSRFQIFPEEEVLERHFGTEFTEYRNRVRRWI
mgnify:CR=1 FL=1